MVAVCKNGEILPVTGKIVGNKTLELKGKVEKTLGKMQSGQGDLKADLKKAG